MLKSRWKISMLTFFATCALLFGAALGVKAVSIGVEALKEIHADNWNVVGKNVIVSGDVRLIFGEYTLRADRAVVNLEGRDFEAVGDIRVVRKVTSVSEVPPEKLSGITSLTNYDVEVTGVKTDPLGGRIASVKLTYIDGTIKCARLVGNLDSGFFRFDDATMRFKNFAARAKSGERKSNGMIELIEAEISPCSYLENHSAHYSFAAKRAEIKPFEPAAYGVKHIDRNYGDHTVWLYNAFAKVYDIPVMWLPVMYKPKDESPGLSGFMFGKSSDWGYYFNFYKRFDFCDYPYISAKAHVDYYSQRGVGYGAEFEMNSENSRTDFFAYGIYDTHPNEHDDYRKYRLNVPHYRYDFRLTNVTHITPRLDFRGAFEYASDYYFTRDFFSGRYNSNSEPATYFALEQQFDYFSAAVYLRPKVMTCYSTVEKLPEVRLDVHRQELFNTNIYYQGDMSADYLKMDWIRFDKRPKISKNFLNNYEAFRFDTTHFLYYPISLKWINIVPRAGFKFTAYSKSSKTDITADDLRVLFNEANPQAMGGIPIKNYDHDGYAKPRLLGELGVEASTKIHNTWQNVRSSFLGLDGLRHIMRPYLNYTYISDTWVDRDNLYYFDDIDRIGEMNFLRIGLENRLQTRAMNSIKEYFSMENYLDIHFNHDTETDQNMIGGFGTILRMQPIKNLELSTEALIDLGNNNPNMDTIRNGRNVGTTGIGAKWLNRWRMSLKYTLFDDFDFMFSYNLDRGFMTRSAYSMGSTMTQIESGSFFNLCNSDYSEEFRFSMSAPLTPDRRTKGYFSAAYDFVYGHFRDISFQITHRMHCIELIGQLSFEYETDRSHSNIWNTSYSVQVRLLGLESPVSNFQNDVLTKASQTALSTESSFWQ